MTSHKHGWFKYAAADAETIRWLFRDREGNSEGKVSLNSRVNCF